MTVENTSTEISYTGNGSVTTFAYNFLVYVESHIFVFIDDVEQGGGFTVNGIGNQNGGNVVFDDPPINGAEVTIKRIVPFTQLIDYQAYGPFDAESNEKGLDLSAMRDLQLQKQIDDLIIGELPDDITKDVKTVTLSQLKQLTILSAGQNYIVSDRNNAVYIVERIDPEQPANNVDIVASEINTEFYFVYRPSEFIKLDQIGGVGDLSVGLMYNADGNPFNLLELTWYRFDTTQLLNDTGPNGTNTYTKAYLISQGYEGTDKLPDDGVVENLTRAQLWARTKAACVDNAPVFARLPYLISKHRKAVSIGRNFFYTSAGCDLTKASYTPKIFGDDEFNSVIATDSDGPFIEASNGMETANFCLYGPAFRKTTADIIDKAEYLNSRGISTKTIGGAPGCQATNWKIAHRSQGFKYDIWMRNSLWCDFSRFKGGGLCSIAASRNDFPDDQSNPDAPAGWNNFSAGGWFHNQNIYTGALLEAQEVGYFGCDTTSNFETLTVQRQYVDTNDNRILPLGDVPTGVYLFAGRDGLRQGWGNKFGNLYAEACWRPVYMRDQITNTVNTIFTQGQALEAPYETPLELDNSVCKILNTRGASQSYFRTDAILRNNSVLYGNTGAINTEVIDKDASSKVFLTGSEIEKFFTKKTINIINGEENKEYVFRDAPILNNSKFTLTIQQRYNGVATFDYVDTYEVTYYDSNIEPVVNRISRVSVGASASLVFDFYKLEIVNDNGTLYLKVVAQRTDTNPLVLLINTVFESAIPTDSEFMTGETITASIPVKNASGAAGGWRTTGVRSLTSSSNPIVITPSKNQRVVITNIYDSSSTSSSRPITITGSDTGEVTEVGAAFAGVDANTSTLDGYFRVGTNTALNTNSGIGENGYLYFKKGESVTLTNSQVTAIHIDYQLQEQS